MFQAQEMIGTIILKVGVFGCEVGEFERGGGRWNP